MSNDPKESDTAQFRCEKALLRLVTEVRRVRRHRQMNAAEPPAAQDAWDRLHLAVLEAEQALDGRTSSARKK